MSTRPLPRIAGETDLERRIIADPEWTAGLTYGTARPGHPEGAVAFHVEDVLRNVDREAFDEGDRRRLRIVALVHDNFKYQVDRSRPKVGENHHGMLGRRFAERYVEDPAVLDVIELHDEAFLAWKMAVGRRKALAGRERALRLLARLRDAESLGLYLRFFRADNATGDKQPDSLRWFFNLCEETHAER